MSPIVFLILGFTTGTLGTLVGAGGGFILVPIFIFLFPELEPARLTAMSLLAVAANSISGTIGYTLRKTVHWPSVLLFGSVGIFGVLGGVALTRSFSRIQYESVFGYFLIAMSAFVIWRSFKKIQTNQTHRSFWNRRNQILGSLGSLGVGAIASLLGIGGGIIHVPLLSELLGYPIHLATGTSHAILALSATVAVLIHFSQGELTPLEPFMPALIVGMILGAQVGAHFAKRIRGPWILRTLGVALALVALRIFTRGAG